MIISDRLCHGFLSARIQLLGCLGIVPRICFLLNHKNVTSHAYLCTCVYKILSIVWCYSHKKSSMSTACEQQSHTSSKGLLQKRDQSLFTPQKTTAGKWREIFSKRKYRKDYGIKKKGQFSHMGCQQPSVCGINMLHVAKRVSFYFFRKKYSIVWADRRGNVAVNGLSDGQVPKIEWEEERRKKGLDTRRIAEGREWKRRNPLKADEGRQAQKKKRERKVDCNMRITKERRGRDGWFTLDDPLQTQGHTYRMYLYAKRLLKICALIFCTVHVFAGSFLFCWWI